MGDEKGGGAGSGVCDDEDGMSDQPEIRYTTTTDGVTIAYDVGGEGMTLIQMSPGLYVSFEYFPDPALVRRVVRLVRFDARGCGHSDRDVEDFSLEAMVRDLTAVADATHSSSFVLTALGPSAGVAIAYAATYPDRVTHLVLVNALLPSKSDPTRHLDDMATADWRLVTESWSRAVAAWEDDELGAAMAAEMREAVSPETFLRYRAAYWTWDVDPYLPRVHAQTLLVHARNHRYFPMEHARKIASRIDGSRISLFDPGQLVLLEPSVLMAIGQFVGVGVTGRERAPVPEGAVVIMFTDIAGSTELTERMGDRAFREAARSLDERMHAAIEQAEGRVIEGKLLGDGVLGVFKSARAAVDAARACVQESADSGLALHVGLHAGDVIVEDGNVFGGAVNIASRICSLSEAGEILVSDVVRGMARTSGGVVFEDRGEREMKGVGETMRVFAVRSPW
jgi:class 3 adenylate cyclase/pimeloyl-ACP methyl ester carboxylesterase